MSNACYYLNWGGYYVCAECGKKFYITNPGEYVYKLPSTTKGGGSLAYFCRWDHLRAWEKKNRPNERFTGHMVVSDDD